MTTTYIYPSAFSPFTSGLASSHGSSSSGVLVSGASSGAAGAIKSATTEASDASKAARGSSLAAFVCHTAYLEQALQREQQAGFFADRPSLLVANRRRIGEGASFVVERAELSGGPASPDGRPVYVAVKTAREGSAAPDRAAEAVRSIRWRDTLFEIRALLHEPLRYHPNILRLLDIRWDTSASLFPTLVVELAEFGTLYSLQRMRPALPFGIKQKLCYDVGRGLSILHACGIVHGDLKHENVLVFANRYSDPPGQPYTAKLADFGGAVMDMAGDGDGRHRMPVSTFPFEAPEVHSGAHLTADGVKRTDAYSYGMLIWRVMLDCDDMFRLAGVVPPLPAPGQRPSDDVRKAMTHAKEADAVLEWAISTVSARFHERGLPAQSLHLVVAALMFTLRGDPAHRALDRAQARMRGMSAQASRVYVEAKNVANARTAASLRRATPGRHGLTLDGVGFALGRMGDEYDAQNNLPGFRPDLPHPSLGGFVFDPVRLGALLDWNHQQAILAEFREAASAASFDPATTELQPWTAAFFLYQCYLVGFGTAIDYPSACRWLLAAADPATETATVDYLARAWVFRVHDALGIDMPLSPAQQQDNLWWSIVRGHRHCSADLRALEARHSREEVRSWTGTISSAESLYRGTTASTGMPVFVERMLRRPWNVESIAALDSEIIKELGDDYESCLRRPQPAAAGAAGGSGGEPKKQQQQDPDYRFDNIFVNKKRGHGLLHLAASMGAEAALRHLLDRYECNINLRNQSHGETPLLCAVRSGNVSCALLLLERGADPSGKATLVQEAPLHCLFNLAEQDMVLLVGRLLDAGADLEQVSGGMREELRGILADWQDMLGLQVTPLGRAVLQQSLPTVRVLLARGADPLGRSSFDEHGKKITYVKSPVELAAVLTLPDILETLLQSVDDRKAQRMHGSKASDGVAQQQQSADLDWDWDENDMLEAAHAGTVTKFDPLLMQSRLVRCGADYKVNLARTLRLLRDRRRRRRQKQAAPDDKTASAGTHHVPEEPTGKSMCAEAAFRGAGLDAIEALLDLGHPAGGSPGWRPIQHAVRANNEAAYRLLVDRGSPLAFPVDEQGAGGEGQGMTLLQWFAARPRYTPTELGIAEHLIGEGVPVEGGPEGVMSALGLAVDRRYFDLADLLILHGAGESLNRFYTSRDIGENSAVRAATGGSGPETGSHGAPEEMSVLGLELQNHTAASLESISYLARVHSVATAASCGEEQQQKQQQQKRGVRINPLCDRTAGLSAVHVLATFPAERWNSHAQTSERIVQKVLDMFPDPASLGRWAVHPRLGTPLAAAVVCANTAAVSSLMQSGFAADLDKTVCVKSCFTRPEEGGKEGEEEHTPRKLATLLADAAIFDFEAAVAAAATDRSSAQSTTATATTRTGMVALFPPSAEQFVKLRRHLEIGWMLAAVPGSDTAVIPDDAERAAEHYAAKAVEFENLMTRASSSAATETAPSPYRQLESALNQLSVSGGAGANPRDPNMPVDLSVITEEIPSGWYEGVEMDAKMAQRVFLKYFRSADSGFGDDITGHMDKAFNTRKGGGSGVAAAS